MRFIGLVFSIFMGFSLYFSPINDCFRLDTTLGLRISEFMSCPNVLFPLIFRKRFLLVFFFFGGCHPVIVSVLPFFSLSLY